MARRDITAASFDGWASTYDSCALRPLYDAARAAILDSATDTGIEALSVLDVGCGTGQLLRAVSARFPFATVVGVDVSAAMLAVAHGGNAVVHGGNQPAALIQAAVEQLPFTDAAFDLVISTMSLRHWSDPREGAREIARVLAPAGLLILAEVFPPARKPAFARMLHRPVPLPESLTVTLAVAGLAPSRVRTVDGFGPVYAITVVIAVKTTSTSTSTMTTRGA